jgi:uncharacterized protein (TIGR02996 family)
MSDEAHFLAGIESQPDDRALRLVYADWLEERGDPRAELIRVEEEMRRVPIYSDRYWELKPRRNALGRKAYTAWLRQMRYGTDYEPVFAEVPGGWKERWRLLREFTERWYGIPMGDVGGRAAEVEKAERRLKRPLPPSVREWVAYAHDLKARRMFHILRDCYTVKILKEVSALSLLIQWERDRLWAVKLENLQADDPPVDDYVWTGTHGGNRFVHDDRQPVIPHVTTFVFRHLSAYLSSWQGRGLGRRVEGIARVIRRLEAAFPVRSDFDGVRIFEADNLIVRVSGDRVWLDTCRAGGSQVPPDCLPELMKLING